MTKISAQRFSKKWRTAALSLVALTVIMVGVLIALPRPHTGQAVASSGWPTYLYNTGRSGFNGAETVINPTSAPNLKLHWSYQSGGIISTQVVAANGLLYWGSWDGYEHATKLNGTQVWLQNLGQTTDTNCSPPTVGVASTATVRWVPIGGTLTPVVFVGGGDAAFYALNANTGAVLWRTPLGTSPNYFLWSSPAFYKGSVYIGVASFGDCPLVQGQLVKMNAATGAIQHIFSVTSAKSCKAGTVWGSPAIDETDGSIYQIAAFIPAHACGDLSPRFGKTRSQLTQLP